jgi:hypothetical protein
LGFGVGVLGFGVLGFGPTPKSPIPNPQSPIPNPHYELIIYYINKFEFLIFLNNLNKYI